MVKGIHFWTCILLSLMVGCASGNCRTQREKDVKADAQAASEKVWVYKYDGSLQCGMGEPVSLEVMQQELKGINIFAAEKRMDGLIRTQVCGNDTGEANLYLIDLKDLEKAKELGFEKWEF